MNDAQLSGIRQTWDDATSIVKNSKTAWEMAETPHSLSRDGNRATTPDGHDWIWDSRFEKWSMWK